MTIDFAEPEPGYGQQGDKVRDPAQAVADMLRMAGSIVPRRTVASWTLLERMVAYDWAVREHWHASDNPRIRRRAKPVFVELSEQ